MPNQRPVSLSKQFTAAILTLTQEHTTIFVRFLKWARKIGHLSSTYAIFPKWLNHSLFPLKSYTDVFEPVIIDQLFDNFCFGTSHFFLHLQNLFILVIEKLMLYQIFFQVVCRKYKYGCVQNQLLTSYYLSSKWQSYNISWQTLPHAASRHKIRILSPSQSHGKQHC